MSPSISIVVPVYKGGDAFRACLKSIGSSTHVPHEVIVVVDGDDAPSAAAAQRCGYTVLHTNVRSGPACARNLGAANATGDILFFIDADVTLHARTVEQVATFFAHAPNVSALIGSYDDTPGAPNFLSQYRNLLHHFTHQQASTEAQTFWGACGAIRRTAFFDVGGFDERYVQPSIEDIEFGYRLRDAGHAIRLCKQIQVKHLKRWDGASVVRTDVLQRALPWSRLLLRQTEKHVDLNVNQTGRISAALTLALLPLLLIAVVYPDWSWLIIGALLLLIALNRNLYTFFAKKRGWGFALRSIPWHLFYYLYSSIAYATAALELRFKQTFARPTDPRKFHSVNVHTTSVQQESIPKQL